MGNKAKETMRGIQQSKIKKKKKDVITYQKDKILHCEIKIWWYKETKENKYQLEIKILKANWVLGLICQASDF